MIKMAYFVLLFLSPLTALAMDNDDSDRSDSNKEIVSSECAEIVDGDDIQILTEDEVESWSSYLLSKGQGAVNGTAKVINYAYEHPKVALYVGLCYAVQYGIPAVAAVSALVGANCTKCSPCDCLCGSSYVRKMGKATGLTECRHICNLTRNQYLGGCPADAGPNCLGCFPCNCRCGSSMVIEMGKASGLTECYQICNISKNNYQGCY